MQNLVRIIQFIVIFMTACFFISVGQSSGGTYTIYGPWSTGLDDALTGSFSETESFSNSDGYGQKISYEPIGSDGGTATAAKSPGGSDFLTVNISGSVDLYYATSGDSELPFVYWGPFVAPAGTNMTDPLTSGTALHGNGTITASGMFEIGACGADRSSNPRATAIWGPVDNMPGENTNNPIPVDDSITTSEEGSSPDPGHVTGAYLCSSVKTVTPVSGSHGRSSPIYVKGLLQGSSGTSKYASLSAAVTTSGEANDTIVGDPAPQGNYAVGYGFISAGDGPKFAKLLLPEALPGGDNTFELFSSDQSYGTVTVGSEFDFTTIAADGVSNFALMGVDPAEQLNPADPFPMSIGLQFATDGMVELHADTYSPAPEPNCTASCSWRSVG